MKVVLMVGSAVAISFALVLGIVIIGVTSASPPAVATESACVTSGPISGLSSVAAANARTVTAVAEPRVGTSGAVVAVMVAYTESGLRVLGNVLTPGASGAQGVGSDHDSLGIFQQRPSWGSVAQRMDPQASARLFVARLATVRGWQSLDPWVAAQKVQVSAYGGTPTLLNGMSSVVGGNYKQFYPLAESVVAKIDHDAAKLSCGALTGGLAASGLPGSHGLPAAYAIPSSATPTERTVVEFALAQLPKPYVFGAAGPAAFDCSGLTMAAWARAGIALAHDTVVQATEGTATSADALVPGDLILVPGDDGTLAAPGHVGLYIGDGLVVNAADEQIGIRVQSYDNFLQVGHGLSALRHIR